MNVVFGRMLYQPLIDTVLIEFVELFLPNVSLIKGLVFFRFKLFTLSFQLEHM